MPARRSQAPDPDEGPKVFTPEGIDIGIRKLRRRIEEVQALGTQPVNYNDPQVDAATRNIHADLIEIFGKRSPEFIAHGAHFVGYPKGHGGHFGPTIRQGQFREGLPKTILMLEGLIRRLEEKQEDLRDDATALVLASFEGLDLHPRISDVCVDLYRGGHYRNAVLDASLALQDYVKERSRCRDRDGADLMRHVFSAKNPIVAFNELADDTDRSEQEGMMHLFEGVMLALRNPRAHALSDDSPEQALEYIALLSLLAKRLEKAYRVRDP